MKKSAYVIYECPLSKRMDLQSEKLLGEAGSADVKAAEEFPEKFKQMIIGKSIIKFIQILWQDK